MAGGYAIGGSAFHMPGAPVAPNLLPFNRVIRYVCRPDLRIRVGKGVKV